MRGILGIDPGWGITAVRVATALVLIRAGYTKLFVWGLDKVTANMASYPMPAPELFAWTATLMELFGGVALLVGLFGRWLGLFYTVEFAIAYFWVKVRMQGITAGNLDLMLLGAAVLFFLAGPGRAAIDSLWLERPRRSASRTARERNRAAA